MNVHQRIKENTQVYHVQIERTLLLHQLMNASINMADYHLLLKKFHAYILPCEKTIRHSRWSSLLKNRDKTPLLINDLSSLGINNSRKKCLNLPPLITQEQILGYLYVIEGATLGGQILAKKLKKQLGVTDHCGAKYFNGYGNNSSVMWTEFCDIINQANALQEQYILSSASITYTTLIDWMNQGHGHT